MTSMESQGDAGEPQEGLTRRRRPGRRLLAGAILLTVGFAGGIATAVALRDTQPSGQNKLLIQDIRATARRLGHECADLTANGTTTQSGTQKNRTIARIFTGGTACRVVVHNGRLSEVSVQQPAILSHNSGPTSYDLRYRDKAQTTTGGAYSWEFYEAVRPAPGNMAGAVIEGFAFSTGGNQTWVVGARKDQLTPDGAVDSSIPFSVPGINEAAGNILYNKVAVGMSEALSQVG